MMSEIVMVLAGSLWRGLRYWAMIGVSRSWVPNRLHRCEVAGPSPLDEVMTMSAAEQFHVSEVSPSYWRVTFDNGPVNPPRSEHHRAARGTDRAHRAEPRPESG